MSLLEQANEDMLVVLDAVDSTRATVMGADTGGMPAIVFAATHPERIEALVLQDSCARVMAAGDYPWGLDEATLSSIIDAVASVGEPAWPWKGLLRASSGTRPRSGGALATSGFRSVRRR